MNVTPYRAATAETPARLPRIKDALIIAVALALVIVSIAMFTMNAISGRVDALIDAQNAAAVRLWLDMEYFSNHAGKDADKSLPPGLFDDTVEFSRNNATLMKLSYRLRLENIFSPSISMPALLGHIEHASGRAASARNGAGRCETAGELPCEFDHVEIDPKTVGADPVQQGMFQIKLYQVIRDYAQDGSSYYKEIIGAVSTYLLPIFYALLGAFLYSLHVGPHAVVRPDEPVPARSSRYVMALIAGATINAFDALIQKDLSLPPLVIAFLVGYSIELLTYRLDRSIEKWKKPRKDKAAGGG